MKKVFKVALVGCGNIAKTHLLDLNETDCAEVVSLCDINEKKATFYKETYAANARVYTDYEKMLEEEKPDSVHITTPHYLHAPMTIAALKRGIHVFLEKPMCISEKEIDDIIAASNESLGKVCVCFQNRFNPSTLKAKELADADGGVLSAYGSVFWDRDEKYYTESGWRGSYATEGGGVMINQAIHTIDMLCQFLGRPTSVCATTANHHLKGIIEVEDSCEGVIRFENGKQGNFYATTSCTLSDDTTVFLKTKNHRIEMRMQKLYVDGNPVELENEHTNDRLKACYGNSHNRLIEKFYHALQSGDDMPVSLESAAYALKILLAAYRSHDEETEIR